MKNLTILIFFLVFSSNILQAKKIKSSAPIKGEILVEESSAPMLNAVCLLIIENQAALARKKQKTDKNRAQNTGYCSSVLVDNKNLLTSAHCLWNDMEEMTNRLVSIKCATRNPTSLIEVKNSEAETSNPIRIKYNLRYRDAIDYEESVQYDIGLINLPEDKLIQNLEPLKIASDNQFREFRQSKNRECRMAGYGETSNNTSGELHTANLDPSFTETIRVSGNAIIADIKKIKDKEGKSFIALGDSGGALYCKLRTDKDPEATEWVLVGINSGGKGQKKSGALNKMFWSKARINF
jgi:hypothetical protein